MKALTHVKGIEVYYDGRCGMCCTFHEWINAQPRAFKVDFIPYQAARAEQTFPGIGTLDPARGMIVRTVENEVYRGAEAWVWCLYSCKKHQTLAKRLGGKTLLPVAIRACRLLAANRLTLSKLFFHRKDQKVRAELHSMQANPCENDFCKLETL